MCKCLIRCGLLTLLAVQSAYVLAEDAGKAALATVKLELSGLQNASGNVYVAVYDSDDSWLGEDTVLDKKVVIADAMQGELVLAELQLPPGEYAISVFYDRNHNGELDTNFIGIPKEPIASPAFSAIKPLIKSRLAQTGSQANRKAVNPKRRGADLEAGSSNSCDPAPGYPGYEDPHKLRGLFNNGDRETADETRNTKKGGS